MQYCSLQHQTLLLSPVTSTTGYCFCFGSKEYNQSGFGVDHLVISSCRVFSCIIGSGCFLCPVCSLGKTLLAFALLHSVFQGQIFLLLKVFLDFLLLHSSPLQCKGHLFCMLVLEGLVGLHRTVWLQLLQHYCSEHRFGLPWYWIVCLGNEPRSFCHFWDCIQVLHLGLLMTMMDTPFLLRDSCPQ